MIEEIQSMLGNIQIEVQHVLREGNKLADYFANLALDLNEVQLYSLASWIVK